MPIGSIQVFAQMIDQVALRRPQSVLDIGIGYGINGAGIRNWLNSGYTPLFNIKLHGVEAFEKYRNPVWSVYDKIIIGDIRKIAKDLENYDAIIMTDVIEHMTKEEGFELIKILKEKINKYLLISTPAIFMTQGTVHGNTYENHLSLWECEDFEQAGLKIYDNGLPGFLRNRMIVATYVK